MKIIEIIPTLDEGGAERFVTDLCNVLSERNEVTLIVLFPLEKYAPLRKELCDNVKILTLNKRLGFDISTLFMLRQRINELKPDIVHTHLRAINYTLMSFIFSKKIKFLHTVHNDAKKEAGGILNTIIRKIAFKFGCVYPITISEESKCSFTRLYRQNSTLIYNGRLPFREPLEVYKSKIAKEVASIKSDKDTKLLVNVARINSQKNQLALALAVDSLNKKGFKIEVAIIGLTNDKEIANKIVNLKSPYIHILGLKPNPRDYMQVADGFCLSSLYEGMPIALIECFSVGAIPVCTPVGGIVNMIEDGKNGILSKSSLQKDIEEALIRFANLTEEEKVQMKKASLDSYCKYKMDVCVKKHEEFMLSLI